MQFTRIKNDVNGNPRYVVHFLEFIPEGKDCQDFGGITNAYKLACKAANKIGGRKYTGKDFGGGIVFQSYNNSDLEKNIKANQLK